MEEGKTCTSCGAAMEETDTTCPSCGAVAETTPATEEGDTEAGGMENNPDMPAGDTGDTEEENQ